MSKNLLSRYIWIIDTIRRHGTISRDELNRLWMLSPYSDGNPMPRRTFYNYRNDIEDIFKVNIVCNHSTFEYSISDADNPQEANITDWMLNTASISNTLTDARGISDRVFLEDVPSARQHLGSVVSALRENRRLKFGYSPFSRTGNPKPVILEPYFLKIFRLRWYITGRNLKENTIKTYALDRMTDCQVLNQTFELPPTFDARAYFSESFGIVFTKGKARKVTLRVDSRQAKYFRALPLHHSQSEMIGDGYSIFNYNLRLTPDLVQELLSYGPSITVLAPGELRAMMVESLQQSLNNYNK